MDLNCLTETPAAIQVRGLEKEFAGQRVLRGLDFCIDHGQHCFLVGANGSGKTTLIQILSGLLMPTKGQVFIDGDDLSIKSGQIRQKLFFLSHETFFYTALTAQENLSFFFNMFWANYNQFKNHSQKIQKSDKENKIKDALHRVSLYYDQNKKIEELSLGMRHRLSMARLLLLDPQIIFMDEPYTGLDQKGEILLDSIIKEKKSKGATVLEASHRLVKIQERIINQNLANDLQLKKKFRLMMLHKGKMSFDSINQPYQVYQQLV